MVICECGKTDKIKTSETNRNLVKGSTTAVDVIHGLLKARNELDYDLEEQVLLLGEKDTPVKKLKKVLGLTWILVVVMFK